MTDKLFIEIQFNEWHCSEECPFFSEPHEGQSPSSRNCSLFNATLQYTFKRKYERCMCCSHLTHRVKQGELRGVTYD